MAHWNGKKIIYHSPQKSSGYPSWLIIDCGCCHGIEWGGDYPRECKRCRGTEWIWKHKKSGALAQYPGGPFIGKE